jgi:hypothetical protein
MSMSITHLKKFLGKMLPILKPKEVLNIEWELSQKTEKEYYLSLTYIVPDNSPYMTFKSLRFSPRIKWNTEINKSISSHFDIKVFINTSGMRTESYSKKLKEWQKN